MINKCTSLWISLLFILYANDGSLNNRQQIDFTIDIYFSDNRQCKTSELSLQLMMEVDYILSKIYNLLNCNRINHINIMNNASSIFYDEIIYFMTETLRLNYANVKDHRSH